MLSYIWRHGVRSVLTETDTCSTSSPVQRHVGVEDGSSHGFGTRVVTDCPQTDCAGLSAQTAALLLYISLHLQPKHTHTKLILILWCASRVVFRSGLNVVLGTELKRFISSAEWNLV